MHVQPTLFDRWSVVCAWGSTRNNFSQQREISCESEEGAGILAAKIIAQKEMRGYKIHKQNPIAESGDMEPGKIVTVGINPERISP